LQCRDTDVWQREWRIGAFRLGLAEDELAVDTLQTVTDLDLTTIQVDLWPPEPEHFAPSKAEDEDQHVGRVERVAAVPSRHEKRLGFLKGPGLDPASPHG